MKGLKTEGGIKVKWLLAGKGGKQEETIGAFREGKEEIGGKGKLWKPPLKCFRASTSNVSVSGVLSKPWISEA